MPDFGEIIGKAKKLIDDHPDKVGQGLDKVGDLVDKGTKGRFSEQIHKGRDMAKERLVHEDGTDDKAGKGDDQGRTPGQLS